MLLYRHANQKALASVDYYYIVFAALIALSLL